MHTYEYVRLARSTEGVNLYIAKKRGLRARKINKRSQVDQVFFSSSSSSNSTPRIYNSNKRVNGAIFLNCYKKKKKEKNRYQEI